MKLLDNKEIFNQLVSLVAEEKHIPESAVRRDYLIVLLLNRLSKSEFGEYCVFKGGTSLSKCFPNSIERFSEDIDLTFLGMDKPDKFCNSNLKKIENLMSEGFNIEKEVENRSKRKKSCFIWYDNEKDKIKLEIGSSVRPDPYSKRTFKSYIHEYIENHYPNYINEFNFESVTLNVLGIERTFIDKIMAVKRHAYNNKLIGKVRHIYDVVKLFSMDEIQTFLKDNVNLSRIVKETKSTDSFYLSQKNVNIEYNPLEKYNFLQFKKYFNEEIKTRYESLHKDLLYTDEKQSFELAIKIFEEINKILESIGE